MNILSIFDTEDFIFDLLIRAEELKKGRVCRDLSKKTLGLVFEKASTRTRASFEVAMTQLGGHSLYLNPRDTQIGRGESIKDTALTLSRYLDGVAIRAISHKTIAEFAGHATIPVINALTDLEHPCQALADLLTIKEKKGGFNVKLAYVGDGNNVCNSLIGGAALAGMEIAVATPPGYEPNREILNKAKDISSSTVTVTNDPYEAVASAEVVYTDVWVSMGQEKSEAQRIKDFKDYQINSGLLDMTSNALVMHCLPAKRGMEITDEVLDGPNSIVFDQAENRLHLQKALIEKVFR
ncbi:MAG TPA: ornithine carbamoyltransferase [Euryarchaeota archaeon]|nr:ornithine carbamoyltransferase [archaeon BMS3Abin16]HDH28646.1 ornithine carbamoyltransferase [Euryarchaeota archaeon]HDY74264.1 ornithine carbamoyltransferase [Euryarchaeota archaeon]